MLQEDFPLCACTAHPKGEDRRKYMFVAEETPKHVVFCCRRCSEIARTPVIQVRTLERGKNYAHQRLLEQNPQTDNQKVQIMRQLQVLRRRRQQMIQYQEADQ